MKKSILLMTVLLITAMVVSGQVVDSTPVDSTVVHQGMTFNDMFQFLLGLVKANWAMVALVILIPIETWLGQTGKIKEGSMVAWLVNTVMKFLFKKVDVVKSKEINTRMYREKQIINKGK
jgi:hypothetical protein